MMRPRLLLPLILLLGALPLRAAEVLVSTDLNAPTAPPANDNGGKITGELPQGWLDDSSWADVRIHYKVGEDQSSKLLNISVSDVRGGRAQFRHSHMFRNERDNLYRLRFRARSSTQMGIEAGIRYADDPWTFVKSRKLSLSSHFQWYDLSLPLPGGFQQSLGLYIYLLEEGSIDIAEMTLERLDKEAYIAELENKYDPSSSINYLRQTLFLTGLPTGWNYSRYVSAGEEVVIGPRAAPDAPSTAPKVLFAANHGRELKLFSAPFSIPLSHKEHTYSFYAKGSGSIAYELIQIGAKGKTIANRRFRLSPDQWKRCELPVTPTLGENQYVAAFQVEGEAMLDALMLNVGGKASTWRPAAVAEHSVTSAATDRPSAVFFDDEPIPLCARVMAGLKKYKVVANIIDADDNRYDLLSERVGVTQKEWELSAEEAIGNRYGPFRVEMWVENEAGKQVSALSEFMFYRLHRPRNYGRVAPEGKLGAHMPHTTRYYWMSKALGADWIRLHDTGGKALLWHYVEPKEGQWELFEEDISRMEQHDLAILGMLGSTPGWESGYREDHFLARWHKPRDLRKFFRYVEKVVGHYKGRIHEWEVWNEPWLADIFFYTLEGGKRKHHGPDDYARMMKGAYKAAKKANPDSIILGINSTTDSHMDFVGNGDVPIGKWHTMELLKKGMEKYCDSYAYHQYSSGIFGYPGDGVDEGLDNALRHPHSELNKPLDKPIIFTEGSAVSQQLRSTFYREVQPKDAPTDWRRMAQQQSAFVLSIYAQDVERVFLYSFEAMDYLGGQYDWRAMVQGDGVLHPSSAALSNLVWHLDDRRVNGQRELAEGIYGTTFSAAGKADLVVVSAKGSHADWFLSEEQAARYQIYDLFGNPLPDESAYTGELWYLVEE